MFNNCVGVTPPTPFVTSIEEDFASIEYRQTMCKYVQVLVVSFYVSKKVFLAFFRQCRPGVLLLDAARQLRMESVCKVVRPDVFSSAVQQTHTFLHEEKGSFLKHDAIPTIFPASGEVEEGT